MTATPKIVGPGGYMVRKTDRVTRKSVPNWSFGKKQRMKFRLEKGEYHETYDN